MIAELIITALVVGIPSTVGSLVAAGENNRFPRVTYNTLVGWWYGAFVPESAAIQTAAIIDSDINTDAWTRKTGWDYGPRDYVELTSERLQIKVRKSERGFCGLWIADKEGKTRTVSVSRYDDSVLAAAISNWEKRRKWNERFKEQEATLGLINERVTKGYIDQIEMVEQRILNSSANTAGELRSLLEPVELKNVTPPKENPRLAKVKRNIDLDEMYSTGNAIGVRQRKM